MGKCKGGIGSGILQNRISAVGYIFFNSQSTHSIITSLQSVICVFLLTVLLGFSVLSVILFGAVIYSVSCLANGSSLLHSHPLSYFYEVAGVALFAMSSFGHRWAISEYFATGQHVFEGGLV